VRNRLRQKIPIFPELTTVVTGHGKLRSYLHRFGLTDNPKCPCEEEGEEEEEEGEGEEEEEEEEEEGEEEEEEEEEGEEEEEDDTGHLIFQCKKLRN
jgi:hypothetical protein